LRVRLLTCDGGEAWRASNQMRVDEVCSDKGVSRLRCSRVYLGTPIAIDDEEEELLLTVLEVESSCKIGAIEGRPLVMK
jgi:hypothetical protein